MDGYSWHKWVQKIGGELAQESHGVIPRSKRYGTLCCRTPGLVFFQCSFGTSSLCVVFAITIKIVML